MKQSLHPMICTVQTLTSQQTAHLPKQGLQSLFHSYCVIIITQIRADVKIVLCHLLKKHIQIFALFE